MYDTFELRPNKTTPRNPANSDIGVHRSFTVSADQFAEALVEQIIEASPRGEEEEEEHCETIRMKEEEEEYYFLSSFTSR